MRHFHINRMEQFFRPEKCKQTAVIISKNVNPFNLVHLLLVNIFFYKNFIFLAYTLSLICHVQ